MNIGILVGHNPFIWQRLKQNHVNVITHTIIKEISGRRVTLADVWAGDESVIDEVDTVVISTGYFPNNGLHKSLEGKVKELYAVGDCVIPRRALNAIHDAYLTAFRI
jgi:thioredoxin reductase